MTGNSLLTNQIPLLVIGTKLDQIHENKRHEVLTRTAFLAEDFNAEEINLVCIFTNACLFLLSGKSRNQRLHKLHSQRRSFIFESGIWVLIQTVVKTGAIQIMRWAQPPCVPIYLQCSDCSNVSHRLFLEKIFKNHTKIKITEDKEWSLILCVVYSCFKKPLSFLNLRVYLKGKQTYKL